MSEKWTSIWNWIETGYSERTKKTSIGMVDAIRMGIDVFGKGERFEEVSK